MAMTYTDLKTNVQDITEMTFTAAQLSMFTKQAEQKIYGFIKDLPILRKQHSVTTSITSATGYTLPVDCLYVHAVLQKTGTGLADRTALLQKDYDFLFEAYPTTSQSGGVSNPELKYYAIRSSDTPDESASRLELAFAPKYDALLQLVVDYQYQPRSIVDTDVSDGSTEEQPWLGENYDSALLNATLVEAARFMKAEPDIIQLYEQQFVLAVQQIADTVNAKIPNNSFRPKAVPPQALTVPAPPQPQQGG